MSVIILDKKPAYNGKGGLVGELFFVECNHCSKREWIPASLVKNRQSKLCSNKCYTEHKKTFIKEKANRYRGEMYKRPWKDKSFYGAVHYWIRTKLGKAIKCTKCGLDKLPSGKKRYFQWANISGEYKRDISDWMQLCVMCHIHYDMEKYL